MRLASLSKYCFDQIDRCDRLLAHYPNVLITDSENDFLIDYGTTKLTLRHKLACYAALVLLWPALALLLIADFFTTPFKRA